MRNVTITVDEETARWARVQAALQDKSVSRFVGEMLREHMRSTTAYEVSRRSYAGRQSAVLNTAGGKYPSKDEIHSR